MPIDPNALGAKGAPSDHSWDSTDAILYALGVGCGTSDLQFTTENTTDTPQRVLPTMAVVLGTGVFGAFAQVGSFNPAMLVHGEQAIELYGEIPVSGTVTTTGEITGIYDKGKGAVVEVTGTSVLAETGEPIFKNVMSAFIRGEGDFGGDRGPSGPRNVPPERDPDASVTYQTREDQALIYRLSGDRNPLHSDPAFAALGGFDRPILHGLCTYGFTGRALLAELCDDDPARFTGIEGRFSSPVLPGEALTVNIWRTGDGEAIYQTTGSDGRVVLDAGRATHT